MGPLTQHVCWLAARVKFKPHSISLTSCLPARLPARPPAFPPACLPPRICFRPRPAIVDLSPSTRLAERVVEGVVTTLEDERDAVLYYLLARHPGRALVSVNAWGSGFADLCLFVFCAHGNLDRVTGRCAWRVEG